MFFDGTFTPLNSLGLKNVALLPNFDPICITQLTPSTKILSHSIEIGTYTRYTKKHITSCSYTVVLVCYKLLILGFSSPNYTRLTNIFITVVLTVT